MPNIKRDNIKIHYDTFGDVSFGEPVLFLSGAGSDGQIWREQVAHLKNDYRIITMDNRGSGKSDCPEYHYSADMLALDVEAILTQERIDAVNLVGFSMGGLIAQRFAGMFPERVTRLALMNCSLGSGNADTVLPEQDVINMFLFSAALTQEDCCRNAMDYNFGTAFSSENPKLHNEYFEYTMQNYRGIPYQIPIMVSDQPLIDDYQAITMPLLCILSLQDQVTPHENGAAFKKYFPQAIVEYLDGYHASMLINPQAVNELLSDFLSTDRSA